MPNRILKESICTSDTVDDLTWFEEVFFYRLLVNCDDYGRMDGRLPILKARLFPLKNSVTEKQIGDALYKLSTVGIVTMYKYDGRPYVQLATWNTHQQIRATRSKYPGPEDSKAQQTQEDDTACNQLISSDINCTRNPIQSESESESESISCTAQSADTFFDTVWALYPNKRGKNKVKPVQRKELARVGFEALALCIERYSQELKALGRGPEYTQNGSTFFNGGYEDYIGADWQCPKPKSAEGRKVTAQKYTQRNYKEDELAALYTDLGD